MPSLAKTLNCSCIQCIYAILGKNWNGENFLLSSKAFALWAISFKLKFENIHRVFHSTDPIPMIPIFPYTHSPIPGNGHLIRSDHLILGEAHKMDGYIKDVKNKSWLALKRQAPIFNHEKAVEQWLTSKIRPDAAQPLTWEWLDAALILY